eukprot:scaffold30339_cov60-Phaeocystis_antarctica.AAC.5
MAVEGAREGSIPEGVKETGPLGSVRCLPKLTWAGGGTSRAAGAAAAPSLLEASLWAAAVPPSSSASLCARACGRARPSSSGVASGGRRPGS